ncbi:MAG TPA: crosslink repair DNA glycosylase YcaQ family protein [Vicinamibacterales bacterium]|nr:crosslink repair DNA glycosylase YcaQ family protein [Vicinamibacterales bacterium]
MTIDDLRRYAVSRSLFPPTSLPAALERLGFVQADPIRAPARAQDLILRHRVRGYRAGDLERHYPRLDVHEDSFINYGFVTDRVFRLMHPRRGPAPWSATRVRHVTRLLEFIRVHGPVHPRQVDDHFSLGTVTNYWGGSSSATTHLLDAMHYRGLLRVARRDAGIRVYELPRPHASPPRPTPSAQHLTHPQLPGVQPEGAEPARVPPAERRRRLDALVDVVVNLYAPLPAASLAYAVRRLRYASPQWAGELTGTLQRAKQRLAHARVDGVDWYWPAGEEPGVASASAEATTDEGTNTVRLLAPFDPVVWDRRRFELLWNWAYRFEAYTPVAKRRWGYYALPLLWRDQVIGWATVSVRGEKLIVETGYVTGTAPRDRRFRQALADERARLSAFLDLARPT